jgi:hypothetical protein
VHNLHVVVVRAGTAEDAIEEAESAIESWGDENNWRSLFAAIGEDGTVYDNRAEGEEKTTWTLEGLNGALGAAVQISEPGKSLSLLLHRMAAGLYDDLETATAREGNTSLYDVKEFVGQLMALNYAGLLGPGKKALREGEHSVFKTHFRQWELDEFGVTHLFDPEDGGEWADPLFAVLVDMHS